MKKPIARLIGSLLTISFLSILSAKLAGNQQSELDALQQSVRNHVISYFPESDRATITELINQIFTDPIEVARDMDSLLPLFPQDMINIYNHAEIAFESPLLKDYTGVSVNFDNSTTRYYQGFGTDASGSEGDISDALIALHDSGISEIRDTNEKGSYFIYLSTIQNAEVVVAVDETNNLSCVYLHRFGPMVEYGGNSYTENNLSEAGQEQIFIYGPGETSMVIRNSILILARDRDLIGNPEGNPEWVFTAENHERIFNYELPLRLFLVSCLADIEHLTGSEINIHHELVPGIDYLGLTNNNHIR